jgi:glutathione peroxidase
VWFEFDWQPASTFTAEKEATRRADGVTSRAIYSVHLFCRLAGLDDVMTAAMIKHLFTSLLAVTTLSVTAHASSLLDIPLQDIDGKPTSLKAYEGKVMLVVNVASKCGLTKQYNGLQALYDKYQDKGLVILGFPCNDFGGQEPGTLEEIKEFCSSKYNVTFPMFSKLSVKGPDQHPLYAELTGEKGAFPGDVKWNFGKFLLDKNGKPLARFEPRTAPDDEAIIKAIEDALK